MSPVKYAQIQESNFGRNFHGKCKNPWKSLEFAGNSNKKMLCECSFHDYLRYSHQISIFLMFSVEIPIEKLT